MSHEVHVKDDQKEGDETYFHAFLSAKRLLRMANLSLISSIDGTHKLIYEGYPIIIVGIIDQNKSFHPLGFVFSTAEDQLGVEFSFITIKEYVKVKGTKLFIRLMLNNILYFFFQKDKDYEPKFLVADAHEGITKGFEAAFGEDYEYTRIHCWAHCERNLEDKMKSLGLNKEFRPLLLNDIRRLQVCKTKTTFDNAAGLFLDKWLEKGDATLDVFLDYFKLEKLTNTPNWYEAAAKFVPSTSNAIESNNRIIKDDETFRDKWPIGRFVPKSLEIVSHWADRNPEKVNCKHFHLFPNLGTKEWKHAYSWLKSKPAILRGEQSGDFRIFFVKSKTAEDFNLTKASVTKYRKQMATPKVTDFDSYTEFEFVLWVLKVHNDACESNWLEKMIQCDCPSFQKNYYCKHSIGLAVLQKFASVPETAKYDIEQIGKLKKRGRPPKARKALVVMLQN